VARFSTEDLAPHDRFALWREVFGRRLLKADMEPVSDGPFRASAMMPALAGIRMTSAARGWRCAD
jgi:hypothetical protein